LKAFRLCLAAIAAVTFGLPAGASAALHRYTVTVDRSLERFDVTVCFDGPAPRSLVADDTAMLHLEKMQLQSPGVGQLEVNDWQAVLTDLPEDACIEYVVQLRAQRNGVQMGGPETRRVGRDLLTSIGDWMWRPAELAEGEDIEVRFQLPPGISVSAPWRQVADGVFRTGATPREWPGVAAFGGFEPIVIAVDGGRLNVAMVDSPPPPLRDMLKRWIERAARSLVTVYGAFPVDELQVVIAPTPRGEKPVPWAYVSRGGGPAIHLFAQGRYPEPEFMRDWTAVHEMSHLFLPYLEWGDAWLVEGLPTYYQNVAMARGGLIPPEEAWRRMYQGFDFAKDIGSELTVYEAGQRLGRRGLYRRVYWGGAAYMLAADLRLRELSGGSQTLGDALHEIHQCCLNEMHRWRAEDFVARLDAETGTTVFSDLFEQQIQERPFPEYDALYVRLGIRILGGHPIFVEGVSAKYRNAIMAPRRVSDE
jgi:hypothetical protein